MSQDPTVSKTAQASFRGAQAFTKRGGGHFTIPREIKNQIHPGDSKQQEIRALTAVAHHAGLMLNAKGE